MPERTANDAVKPLRSSLEAAASLLRLGETHCGTGRLADAHKAYVGALEIIEEKLGPDDLSLARIYCLLAELELMRERYTTGEPYARRSLEICGRDTRACAAELARSRGVLAALLERQGRSAESEFTL